MKKHILYIFPVLILLFQPVWAWATDHYVSPHGTASWGASINQATPCAVSTAAANAVAGDRILLADGTYDAVIDSANSGTGPADGQRIIWQAQNRHQAVFAPTGDYQALYSNDSYISFRQIAVSVPDYAQYNFGAHFNSNSKYTEIDDCLIYAAVETSSDEIWGVMNEGANNRITNNEIRYVEVGIVNNGDGAAGGLVDGNYVHDLTNGQIGLADGIRAVNGDHKGLTISNNTITAYGGDGIDMWDGSNVIAEHNEIFKPLAAATPGNGIKMGGTGIPTGNIARYNYVHDLEAAGDAALNYGIVSNDGEQLLILYNLIDNTNVGIYVYQGNNKETVYGNTVVNSTYALRFDSNSTGNTAQNNILDGLTADLFIGGSSSVAGGYNCLRNDSSVAGGGSYINTNFSDKYKTNPLFTDPSNKKYTLQSSSPCINAGTIPSSFKSAFPLNPNATTYDPWDPVVLTSDYGNREIGVFGFIGTVSNNRSLPFFRYYWYF
jgi:Right handed beta helix region